MGVSDIFYVLRGIWGGGAKYFFPGAKCPPSLETLKKNKEFLAKKREKRKKKTRNSKKQGMEDQGSFHVFCFRMFCFLPSSQKSPTPIKIKLPPPPPKNPKYPPPLTKLVDSRESPGIGNSNYSGESAWRAKNRGFKCE